MLYFLVAWSIYQFIENMAVLNLPPVPETPTLFQVNALVSLIIGFWALNKILGA